MDAVYTESSEARLEARYLARVDRYRNRGAALASLSRYPLIPSAIEECNEGWIFRYFLWPAGPVPVLYWPVTELRGIPRFDSGETYSTADMIKAGLLRRAVTESIMSPVPRAINRGQAKHNPIVREALANCGLSINAMGSIYRWMPVGSNRFGIEYPFYIMNKARISLATLIRCAIASDIPRFESNGLLFLDMDAFYDKNQFLAEYGYPRSSQKQLGEGQYIKAFIRQGERILFGIDTKELQETILVPTRAENWSLLKEVECVNGVDVYANRAQKVFQRFITRNRKRTGKRTSKKARKPIELVSPEYEQYGDDQCHEVNGGAS